LVGEPHREAAEAQLVGLAALDPPYLRMTLSNQCAAKGGGPAAGWEAMS